MTACSLDSQNSPVPMNGASIRHWSANYLRPHKSLIFLPRHGYCDAFFVGIILESFRLGAIWRALRKRDDYVLRGERPRRITPSSISIILHKILSLIHYLLILCTSSFLNTETWQDFDPFRLIQGVHLISSPVTWGFNEFYLWHLVYLIFPLDWCLCLPLWNKH